jgi:uncharacterized protein YqgC (DUF456 family)
MYSSPESDDQSALEAFRQSLPRESLSDRREISEAGAKKVKRALLRVQGYSLCVSVGAAAATLIQRPMPLLPGIAIAVGAILGAVAGSVVSGLYALLFYLRWNWLSEERVDVVPMVWRYGPLGAILGSLLITLAVISRLDKANESTMPTLLGGIAGSLVCAVVRSIIPCALGGDGAVTKRRIFRP